MLADREKISVRQAVILFLTLVYSPSIRVFPILISKTAERSGWLASLSAALPFIILVYLLQGFFKKEKEASLSDIYVKILGKFAGKALLVLYTVWITILAGMSVRYLGERFLTALLPNTPMPFFTVTILAAVFYAVRGGIVNLTRTTEFLFLLFSVVYVVLFLLSLKKVEIINLFPVTYYDIWPLTKTSVSILGIWSYLSYIFFFGDKINDKEHIKRFGLQGTIYLIIATSILLIQTIGVYGYTIIERVSLPYFLSVKSISILETLERIESVAMALWIMVDFIIISVFIYIVVSLTKFLFSVSNTKELVSPVVLIGYLISLFIARNRFELTEFTNHIGLHMNVLLGFIIPLVVFIIGKIRRKI